MPTLGADGIVRFRALQTLAVAEVTARFYETHGSAYERFGPRGLEACREDLTFHLEFLRPVLEFGLLQPMVDYLEWLASVLGARGIPAEHLSQSLEFLSDFFVAQLPPADGAIVAGTLDIVIARFRRRGDTETRVRMEESPWPETGAFEAALLAGNQATALAIVTTLLDGGKTLVEVELHLIQPALYHIGELWQENQVSVAQEHMATAMVQSIMTVCLVRSTPPTATGHRVLLACVEGNNHAIGLRMVADAFQLGGWDVQYLGANMPANALVQQVEEWRPHLVGLSVGFAQQLPAARAAIALLKTRFGDASPAVIVGGLAMNRFGQLADFVGAASCPADAPSAFDFASTLPGA